MMNMWQRVKKHLRVWRLLAINEFQLTFVNRWSNLLFILGKAMRFAMTLLVLILIRNQITNFATYTTDQLIVFFITFQWVDLVAQIFFRGVYVFRNKVNSGEFDFYLLHPINPLLRSLFGKPDINDIVFLVPVTVINLWLILQLQLQITIDSLILYLFLLINGLLIAMSFHVLVLSLGIITMEVDNAIMLYRDLTLLGRFPIDVYFEPLRSLLFLLIPIGLMITVPAQILMNLHPSRSIIYTSLVGIGFFLTSLIIWRWSLKKYASVGG